MISEGMFVDCGRWRLRDLRREGVVMQFSFSVEVSQSEAVEVRDELRERIGDEIKSWGRTRWSKKRRQDKKRKKVSP